MNHSFLFLTKIRKTSADRQCFFWPKPDEKTLKNYNFSFFVSPGTIYEMIDSKIDNYIPGAETISEFNYLDNNEINIVKTRKNVQKVQE